MDWEEVVCQGSLLWSFLRIQPSTILQFSSTCNTMKILYSASQESNFSCMKAVNAIIGGQHCLLQIGTCVEIRIRWKALRAQFQIVLVQLPGWEANLPQKGKEILLFLKWEDAHFSLRNPFSFSLAVQLLHLFYTHTYIDDSLELLSRTHFPFSFSTPKYIVKCLLL